VKVLSQRDWILSIDVGTSSVKATVFDDGAQLIAERSCGYPLIQPQQGWVEQDPIQVQKAFHQAIRSVLKDVKKRPKVMVLSTAMHALMGLDLEERPVTHFVTWADQRAEAIARELRSNSKGLELYQKTGTPIHAMSPLLKLAWFRDNQPDVFSQVKIWVDLKSYILHELLGNWLIDESLASATGLYNLFTHDWDSEAMQWCGVTKEQLPRLVKTTEILQGIRPELVTELGLATDTLVIAGASDGALANLGVGAVQPGSFAISIGTSGAVRGIVPQPKCDPEGRLFCYVVDDHHYIVGGPINNGGIILRWLQGLFYSGNHSGEELASDTLSSNDFYTRMNEEVSAISPGSEGLFCLPYLTGERAPLWREDVSGSFWGLKLSHNRAHMVRAALEGICYQLNGVVKLLERMTGKAQEIRATGGFSNSKVWVKILTDILGTPLGIPEHTQGSALGGAFLAWYALGQLESLEGCADWVPLSRIQEPRSEFQKRYEEGYQLYQELVRLGETQFHRLYEFAQKGASK
jgi:gluconokinase